MKILNKILCVLFKKKSICIQTPTIKTVESDHKINLKAWQKEFNFGRSYSNHAPLSEKESLDPKFIGGKEFQIKQAIRNRANFDMTDYN